MRILWITNVLFPEATAKLMGEKDIRGTGGWMIGLAESINKHDTNTQLFVAALSSLVSDLREVKCDMIHYFAIPSRGDEQYYKEYEGYYRDIYQKVKPDIVHIHGTEFPHSLACINAFGPEKVCVSIQGLASVYYKHYMAGLSLFDIMLSITPASLLKNGILQGYRSLKRRAKFEEETIRKASHVLGRTTWDKDHIWAINPAANYYYGGEILRSEFYMGDVWKYNRCCHHSIFISQSGYPLKGLHQVLKAMPLVIRHYPDTTIRVAGNDITRSGGLKERIKLSDWGNIVKKLIKKNKLEDRVVFTGPLNAEEMKKEYLNSNVFVCPSCIENSPNSLGEAQVLGVPIVASYVGGVMDMMKGDEKHLYRFEEVEMLAQKIVCLFDEADRVNTEAMRQKALLRHNPVLVTKQIFDIYNKIACL